MFMKRVSIILISAFSSLLFVGCVGGGQSDDGKLNVVTTVGMVADMVENVGGDLVIVDSLMGPGVDPHLYKPSAGDIALMEDADIIFYVGLHLEGKMVEVLESLAEKKDVVAISRQLDTAKLLAPQAGQTGSNDPHIWFDVELWSNTISEVEQTLIVADPENAAVYRKNAEVYLQKLQELDIWVAEQISLIPEDQRVMITAHDAFNYFGVAYGMDVRGLQGISTASEYGLKDLEQMIDFIVEREIKAVFVESSVPKKSIEALQEGVRAAGWDTKIGGELFSDAMGDPESEEGTYIGMVKHNVNTIVNALK